MSTSAYKTTVLYLVSTQNQCYGCREKLQSVTGHSGHNKPQSSFFRILTDNISTQTQTHTNPNVFIKTFFITWFNFYLNPEILQALYQSVVVKREQSHEA